MTTWHRWKTHFETNAARVLPAVELNLSCSELRALLAHSLAKLQVGEAGEGRIAQEIDRTSLEGIDDDYRAALKLFVREEGRHARILGLMVKELGGQLLGRQWTERLFLHFRRALGIRFKLLVLLAAEVIAISFYGALAEVLGPSPLTAALEEICLDEEHHLAFHRDFFRIQTGLARKVLWLAWWPLAWAAAVTVAIDHQKTLVGLGVSRSELWKRIARRINEAGQFGAAPRRAIFVGP